MKQFVLILLFVQLSLFTISYSQITFTREWVTGKRSGLTKPKILINEESTVVCKSLIPAIDFLLEAEKVREKVCGFPPSKEMPYSLVFSRPIQQSELVNPVNQAVEEINNFEGSFGSPGRKST